MVAYAYFFSSFDSRCDSTCCHDDMYIKEFKLWENTNYYDSKNYDGDHQSPKFPKQTKTEAESLFTSMFSLYFHININSSIHRIVPI